MNFLHLHQESQSLSAWTTTQRRFSRQSTINNLATPSTTPTVISATSSTSGEMPVQLSSTEGKNVKKQRHTVQPPIIDYPTTASATRVSAATSVPYFLHRQNSQRMMIHHPWNESIASSMHNAFYIPRPSTRPSSASI